MSLYSDNLLISYVQKVINAGNTKIDIPADLMQNASAEAVKTVRQLCKLAGVKISINVN